MTDVEARVEAAYLARLGRAWRPAREIHPADEMYLWTEEIGVPLASRRVQYMIAGHEVLLLLEHLADCLGRELSSCAALLDFACGYGRSTRFLVHEVGAERMLCSDIVVDAVDWLAATLGVPTMASAQDPADVVFEREFELIWVGSLFSHLPRHRFGSWLAKLYGALAPDGVLIFSTHGAGLCPPDAEDPSGFSFVRRSESRTLSLDEYGATYATPEVVRAIADEVGVGHLRGLEREVWGVQDVYAAARSALPGLERWNHAPRLLGGIFRSEVDDKRRGRIGGWCISPAHAGAASAVRVHVEGLAPIPTSLSEPREAHDGNFLHVEWQVEGPLPASVAEGAVPVLAVGELVSGGSFCFDGGVLEVPR